MSDGLTIADAPPPGYGGNLAQGMVGVQYDTQLSVEGGSGRYRWITASTSAMPPGLTLREDGAISGVPSRLAEGTNSITVQVSDVDKKFGERQFSLIINPGVRISKTTHLEGPDSIRLEATGGSPAPPGFPQYTWEVVRGPLPAWLDLDQDTGVVTVRREQLRGLQTSQFTVRATDSAFHSDEASFSIIVRPGSRFRHPFRPQPEISILDIELRSKRRLPPLGRLAHLTTWLGILALGVPILGGIWIFVYAFTTPGSHGTYLGVGMLTAIAALLSGCLIGFLFGIPRVVSSGQYRFGSSSDYAPSSNLSEVSDWLTKLLLGAGLVQLTHLGVPIGNLINHIAGALYTTAAFKEAAKVAAGTILFGYVAIGLLDGYVVTTMWYQRKLAQQNPAADNAGGVGNTPSGSGSNQS